jgi:hypothetical protein
MIRSASILVLRLLVGVDARAGDSLSLACVQQVNLHRPTRVKYMR